MWEIHVAYSTIILLCIAFCFVILIKFHKKELIIKHLRIENDAYSTQLIRVDRELTNLRYEQLIHLREQTLNGLSNEKKRNLLIDLYDSCIIRNDFKQTKQLLTRVAKIKNDTVKNKPNVGG